jgi:hypothetical protein
MEVGADKSALANVGRQPISSPSCDALNRRKAVAFEHEESDDIPFRSLPLKRIHYALTTPSLLSKSRLIILALPGHRC